MKRKISVIIPTLNSSGTLPELLNSLMEQGYRYFEIIAVDGGSTDDTLEILSKYPIRILHEEMRGIGAARKKGVDNAKGDFIAFVDSDCIAPTDWLSKLFSKIRNRKDVAAVGGIAMPKSSSLVSKCLQYRLFGLEKIKKEIGVESIPTMNAIYRKDAILSVGNFNEKYELGEDPELNFRLRKKGFNIIYSPEIIVIHDHPVTMKQLLSKWFRYSEWFVKLYIKEWRTFFQKIFPRIFYLSIFIFSILRFWNRPYIPSVIFLLPSVIYIRAALKASLENKDLKLLFALPLIHLSKLQVHSIGVLYYLVLNILL